LSLEQVSASTKISVALLDGLERDDLSRWPTGFYRRSFFRAYLTALGLGPEAFADELARLLPAEPSSECLSTGGAVLTASAAEEPLALVFAGVAAPGRSLSRRGLFAGIEAAAILTIGSLVAWAGEMPVLTGSGVVALLYYPAIRTTGGRIGTLRSVFHGPTEAKSNPANQQSRARSSIMALHSAAGRIQLAIATSYQRLRQLQRHVVHFCRPVTAWMIKHTHGVLTHALDVLTRLVTATWRGSQFGAETIRHVVLRAFSWTVVIFGGLSRATRRAVTAVMTHGRRFTIRCVRTVNYAFWIGVRAAADRAQRLAMRQLAQARSHFSGNGDCPSAAADGVFLSAAGAAPSEPADAGALCSSAQASASNT
jgi:hypothetical protein